MLQIATVRALPPSILVIRWKGRRRVSRINLSHWVSMGGRITSQLRDPAIFARAKVGHWGWDIYWGDDPDGDLAIDGFHLQMIEVGEAYYGPPGKPIHCRILRSTAWYPHRQHAYLRG